MLEIVAPGPLLTIQDAGRPGLAHLGVPPSGAADPWACTAANLLAGAPPGAPALEVTLGGTWLRATETCTIAVAGADLGAELDDGRRLPPGSTHRLPAGAGLRFGGGPSGMRAYIALAGGVDVPAVLGSASTCLPAGLGGIDGRALRTGDSVRPVLRGDPGGDGRRWPVGLAPHPSVSHGPLRFVPGPDTRHLPSGIARELAARTWRVGESSDRMGIRLDGAPLPAGREILSHPMLTGAIQVPADGRPVILFVDGPTIGGYPVVGVVPRWEWPRLGQLRPGDEITFATQDVAEARAAWRAQLEALATAARELRTDALWDRLADGAGG